MRRRIILEERDPGTIPFAQVHSGRPIFVEKKGKLRGMVVKDKDGWIVMIGGSRSVTGWHPTLRLCLESCVEYDYEFFVEDE